MVTVKQLRAELSSRGLDTKGPKQVLLARLATAKSFEPKQENDDDDYDCLEQKPTVDEAPSKKPIKSEPVTTARSTTCPTRSAPARVPAKAVRAKSESRHGQEGSTAVSQQVSFNQTVKPDPLAGLSAERLRRYEYYRRSAFTENSMAKALCELAE